MAWREHLPGHGAAAFPAAPGSSPPACYAGISTTRHMVGMNLATSLAFVVAVVLAVSLIRQALARPRRPAAAGAGRRPGQRAPVSPGSRR